MPPVKTMRVQEVTLAIHPLTANEIKRHAKREAEKGAYEAVGFLASHPEGEDPDLVRAVRPMHNHASNPQDAFFVEPWEQFQAEKELREGGYTIKGTYHSHVKSEALPSQMDHKMSRPREFVLIYSVVFDDLKAYIEEDGTLTPVTLHVAG